MSMNMRLFRNGNGAQRPGESEACHLIRCSIHRLPAEDC